MEKKVYRLSQDVRVGIVRWHTNMSLKNCDIPTLYKTAYSKAQAKTYFKRDIAKRLYVAIQDIVILDSDIEICERK